MRSLAIYDNSILGNNLLLGVLALFLFSSTTSHTRNIPVAYRIENLDVRERNSSRKDVSFLQALHLVFPEIKEPTHSFQEVVFAIKNQLTFTLFLKKYIISSHKTWATQTTRHHREKPFPSAIA